MDLRHEFDGDTLAVPLDDALLPGAEADTDVDVRIVRLLSDTHARKLLLDFTGVRNLRSMGIAALMQVHKACKEKGVALAVCGLDPEVAHVFRVTALTRVFSVYTTATEARGAFGRGDDPDER